MHASVGPEIAHAKEGTTPAYQRLGQPRHADEAMATDVHGCQETVAGAIGHAVVQALQAAEGDDMSEIRDWT
jgi:hypothetical protein